MISRLPPWLRTVRVRLALTYSGLLFGITALQTLRDYSIAALVIMFGLSLAIGWWVAGRALRPVE